MLLIIILISFLFNTFFSNIAFAENTNNNIRIVSAKTVNGELYLGFENASNVLEYNCSIVPYSLNIGGGLGKCSDINVPRFIDRYLTRREIRDIRNNVKGIEAQTQTLLTSAITGIGIIDTGSGVIATIVDFFNNNSQISEKLVDIITDTPDNGATIRFHLSCSNIMRGRDNLYYIKLNDVSIVR